MINLPNHEVTELENLADKKLKLLLELEQSMKSFHEVISNNNSDEVDDFIARHQRYFDQIDGIDEMFLLSLNNFDQDKSVLIKGFFSADFNKLELPDWCKKLYGSMKTQKDILLHISELNNEITLQIKNYSLQIQKQLQIIKQKKEINTNYNPNIKENSGSILDYKDI